MSQFELSCLVNRMRLAPWVVMRVGTNRSYSFGIEFTLDLYRKDGRRAVRRTTTFRRLWENRLKELLGRGLWRLDSAGHADPFHPEFNLKRFMTSYRRCLFCRPSYLYFKRRNKTRKINYQVRPCWRNHLCPFCFARLSTAQYRYVKGKVNEVLRANDNDTDLTAYCRVARLFVPAVGFTPHMGCDADHIGHLSKPLRQAIDRQRAIYAKITKKLQRNTAGSLWRLVVVPTETGWFLEVRQFLLCRAKVTPPLIKDRALTVTHFKKLRITRKDQPAHEFDDNFYRHFGEFCRYPKTLLTGPCELTAAYLRAVHAVRLLSGTGMLRRTGKTLIKFFKQISLARQEKKRVTTETAAGLAAEEPAAAQTAPVERGDQEAGAVPL